MFNVNQLIETNRFSCSYFVLIFMQAIIFSATFCKKSIYIFSKFMHVLPFFLKNLTKSAICSQKPYKVTHCMKFPMLPISVQDFCDENKTPGLFSVITISGSIARVRTHYLQSARWTHYQLDHSDKLFTY